MQNKTKSIDLVFENHLSLFLIHSLSVVGKQWLDENVKDESTHTFGDAVVCESRFVDSIYHGAISEGLVCS
jgi:hypothetical protein